MVESFIIQKNQLKDFGAVKFLQGEYYRVHKHRHRLLQMKETHYIQEQIYYNYIRTISMFEHFTPQIEAKNKLKVVTFLKNGDPEKSIRCEYMKILTKEQILRSIEKEWGINLGKCIRIFSVEGIEYVEQDLLYLKNEERLYISKGEEFDSNNNFGQFQIIKKLGQGGFGCVQLAKNKITNEFAAIKILKTSKNSTSSDIDMLFREAEYLKSLNHPHIVKILNCYALKDMKVIIVMEYLEGGELLELLKQKKKFTQEEARFYFKQIVSAVSYCHRQGIIHRDLKLQNLLLKNSKILKVADFGISGVADRFNPEADWGTLRYMAPEILSGKNRVNTPAVDVWACGIILYQLLVGHVPFDGASTSQIVQAITKKPFILPIGLQISQSCQQLLNKMLMKNPGLRINVSDIQTDPWLLSNERPQSSVKTLGSEELSLRLTDIKKQQRKSINLPRPHLNVKIPKRLEKEKDQLQEQLRGYYKGQNRRNIRSESKLFPQLNHRKRKYAQQKSRPTLLEEKPKKQIFKGWK